MDTVLFCGVTAGLGWAVTDSFLGCSAGFGCAAGEGVSFFCGTGGVIFSKLTLVASAEAGGTTSVGFLGCSAGAFFCASAFGAVVCSGFFIVDAAFF